MNAKAQVPASKIRKEEEDEIERQKVELAKQRQKRLDQERLASNIKTGVGAATSVATGLFALYKLQKQMEKHEGTQNAELDVLRKQLKMKEVSLKNVQMVGGTVAALVGVNKLVSSYGDWLKKFWPSEWKKWYAEKEAESNQFERMANQNAARNATAEGIKTTVENLSGISKYFSDLYEYQMSPSPTEQFPQMIQHITYGDTDPNKPIGPWNQVKEDVYGETIRKDGEKIKWSRKDKVYRFGEQPKMLQRYALDKFTKPLLDDPGLTVKYNVIKDPENEWYSLERKPPDPAALYNAGSTISQIFGAMLSDPNGQWAARKALDALITMGVG
jgi:hypothetical protein